MRRYKRDAEPETRVGLCCGCREDRVSLFKVPGIFRYRCAACFRKETGFNHHMAPPPPASVIIVP
jgi:hypothetical protein